MENIMLYKGRPVVSLTREELIEALIEMDRMLDDERRLHQKTRELFL